MTVDLSDLAAFLKTTYVPNGAGEDDVDLPPAIAVETWDEFSAKAGEQIPTLVDGLWPEQALGFIAAPPKKGKTWIALALGISVATGKPYLGRFRVQQPRNVLYVALEGHRAAIRHRVGAICHGLDINAGPGGDLERLRWAYKPRGINISDPAWSAALRETANQTDSALVIIDVLRAAAVMRENVSEDFAILRKNLEQILADGRSIGLLHHFGKLTEITKDRTPGERMSGSGAMYGAMDIGVFITGSENGAKNLRVEIESRDLATPDRLGIHIRGTGSGDHGGFLYTDKATIDCDDDTPDERDIKAPAEEIHDYIVSEGGDVEAKVVRAYFEISDHTLTRRLGRLMQLGIDYVGGPGKPGRLVVRPIPKSPDPELFGTSELGTETQETSGIQPSSEHLRTQGTSEFESGDLQAESNSEVPTSPTERQPASRRLPFSGALDPDDPGPTEPALQDDLPF